MYRHWHTVCVYLFHFDYHNCHESKTIKIYKSFAKRKNKAQWLAEKMIKEQFAHHLLLARGVILMLAVWKESTAFQSTLRE